MEVNIQPRLRFSEFKESWNKTFLNDIATFSKGKNISKSDIAEDGSIECIRYGELYTDYNETIENIVSKTDLPNKDLVFSISNDIIIPSSGETQLDIATASCVLKSNVALGGDLNIIRTEEDGIFISYYLNSTKKKANASLAQGNSVVHLYNHHLKGLKLNLPSYKEQQKIASFLKSVDKKIKLLKKKKDLLEQHKKGVMQLIVSQQIRFKDENGNDYPDWEERRLERCLNYEQPTKYIVNSAEYDDDYQTPVLTAGKTFILGYTDETDNIFTDTPVIIFDDFTMANKFVDFNFKIKSSAMKILKAVNDEVNLKYVYESMQMIRYPKGDEHKRFWISEYSKIKIKFPCIEEQNKLADFLSAIDAKIQLVNTQLENTQTFKKGLLQQMFV